MSRPTWRWRFGGIRVHRAQTRTEAGLLACELGAEIVLLDAEPAVVHWSEPSDALVVGVEQWIDLLPGDPIVKICTNSRRFHPRSIDRVPIIAAARKPWTRRERILQRDESDATVVVVGDLLVLDGIMALRFGCEFIWLSQQAPVPPWPLLLSHVDRILARLALRRVEDRATGDIGDA